MWFDIEDIDAAVAELDAAHARLEERHPRRATRERGEPVARGLLCALRGPATGMKSAQLLADDLSIDDRRRGLQRRGPTWPRRRIEDMRAVADFGVETSRQTVIAIRGDVSSSVRIVSRRRDRP